MNAAEEPMRIAIVAPGGVGCYFGGMLAKAGGDVAPLARGAHPAAIREAGLRVDGPRGDGTFRMNASDDAGSLGVADIVLFAATFYQAEEVARADGVTLPDDIEETWLTRLKGLPPRMYASMLHDIAKGGPLEVDGFSGHIVREGRRLGVPTPHHATL